MGIDLCVLANGMSWQKKSESELEIYEGLDVARLDLHDAPDGEGHKRHLPPERGVDDAVADVDIDLLGQEVHGVAQHYECEDGLVSLDHLRDDCRVEVVEYLVEHDVYGLHVLGAEEQPSEAYQIEREDDTHHAQHDVHILAVDLGPRHHGHPHLVQGEGHAVQRAPEDEAHGGTVPQAAEKHRQQQVDVCAHAALAVAAERYVEVVAQPR